MNWYNAEFEWENRRFKVVNWDDTDGLWIAQDRWGNIRYFTPEKLNEIFPEKGLTKPH